MRVIEASTSNNSLVEDSRDDAGRGNEYPAKDVWQTRQEEMERERNIILYILFGCCGLKRVLIYAKNPKTC
jgi:hypothetical protein